MHYAICKHARQQRDPGSMHNMTGSMSGCSHADWRTIAPRMKRMGKQGDIEGRSKEVHSRIPGGVQGPYTRGITQTGDTLRPTRSDTQGQ